MSERPPEETPGDSPQPDPSGQPPEQTFAPDAGYSVPNILPHTPPRLTPHAGRGRRSHTIATDRGGHFLRAVRPTGPARDIALLATLRAAALRMSESANPRIRESATLRPCDPATLVISKSPNLQSPNLLISPADLRIKLRRARTGNLILFVVDASGSMAARKRMIAVKGAVLSLLLEAYQKRDRVGLIAFRGSGAELLVPPTNSVEVAERRLRHLPTGGRTPLTAALHLAGQTLAQHLERDEALTPLLVLVTDGRANEGRPEHLRQAALALGRQRIAGLVLDSEQGYVRLGAAQEIAVWLGADYVRLDRLRGEDIALSVRGRLGL